MSKLARPFRTWTTYPGHGGIDYPQARGAAVRASGPGIIDFSGYYSARGGYAKFITYDCGCRHGYYHFDREQGLGRGARVDYGTTFAFVGSLGQNSTGPHLHHEVWDGRSSIIKPPGYWDYVDVNSFVGDGTTTGGSNPFIPEEDDMPYTEAQLKKIIHDTVVSVLRAPEFRDIRNGEIAEAVHIRKVSDDTGTLAETTRDARVIARRAEDKVERLAAGLGVDLTG